VSLPLNVSCESFEHDEKSFVRVLLKTDRRASQKTKYIIFYNVVRVTCLILRPLGRLPTPTNNPSHLLAISYVT